MASSFQHYEELRLILSRLDATLPGHPSKPHEREEDEEGWDWRTTVIEAKPLSVSRLALGAGAWPFTGEIPVAHQTHMSRRWFITERMQIHTSEVQADASVSPTPLPPGTTLWHPSEKARRLMILAMHDCRSLFEGEVERPSLPCNNEWHQNDARIVLFATPGPAELCFSDSIDLLLPTAPYLARLAQEYGRMLARIYGIQWPAFGAMCRLHITWHASKSATPARLPPASTCRYENGPIARVGLGRRALLHDFIPCLVDPSCAGNDVPVRLAVGEGVLVCSDGAGRMRYSHGHPATAGGGREWVTFTYFLDCTPQSKAIGYDPETRAVIMSTPVSKERVVTSTPLPSPCKGLPMDAMSALVRKIRLRLRIAESHVLASRQRSALSS